MGLSAWVLVTADKHVPAMIAAARDLEAAVTAVVVGPRALAETTAGAAPDQVLWIEPDDSEPVEASAGRLAAAAAAARPRVVIATPDPAARVLLGAVTCRLGAALVPGVIGLRADGETIVIERSAIGGQVIRTLEATGPVAVVLTGEDKPSVGGTPAPITRLSPTEPASAMRLSGRRMIEQATGVRDATRVVSVGRGLKAKADLALVEELATTLGAEIACSMPIAEDVAWVPKERYVGRSGQHIAPRLYLALGVSGAPQHMEGVREAKVVAAINSDPKAPIFRTADYGIVGDLYEVVPALIAALRS